MAIENNNKKVSFGVNTSEVISDILKKYQLEETDGELENIGKNIFSEKTEPYIFRGAAILKIALSLAKKELLETEASSILQKDLGTPKEIAEKIIDDIKKEILPFSIAEKNIPSPTTEKLNISGSEIPVNEPVENSPINTAPTAPKRIKKVPTVITETPKQSNGPDSYREPIE